MPRKRKKENKCRKCVYRSGTPDDNGCDFLYLTGKRRGCPADENCARFEEGPRPARRPADLGPVERDPGEKDIRVFESEKRRRTHGYKEALRSYADSKE